MRIDLLEFLLEAKDGLQVTIPFSMPSILFDRVTETAKDVRQLVAQVSVKRTLSSILVYMCRYGPAVHDVYRNAFLIRAPGGDDAKRTQVDLLATVANEEDHHFFLTVVTPRLAVIPLAEISNVLVHGLSPLLQTVMTMNSSVRRGGS